MRDAVANECVSVVERDDGQVWTVTLNAPKGNVIDIRMIEGLTKAFDKASASKNLKVIILAGAGRHFSFGASVEEHRPGRVDSMLRDFHQMFLAALDSSIVMLAVVRGQCLGGGLELASFCHRVFAAPEAKFGQPEIVLGVFAPVASILLSERVGRGNAEDLCLSGRTLSAEDALRMGLVDVIDEDPMAMAISYATEHFLPRSASSLHFAVQAIRHGYDHKFRKEIACLEDLYLNGLMSSKDAKEGLNAFLERRQPEWRNE